MQVESNNSQKIVNELISISKKLSNPDKEKKVSETLILILDDNIKQSEKFKLIKQIFEHQEFEYLKLTSIEIQKILKKANSLEMVGLFYSFKQLIPKFEANEFRNRIRDLLDSQLIGNKYYESFFINECLNANTQQELNQYIEYITYIAKLLIDISEDNTRLYFFTEPLIKSICLVMNQQYQGNKLPIIFKQLIDQFDKNQNLFFWQILFDVIFQCALIQEKPDSLIQPNLVCALILQQMPVQFIDKLMEYLGDYILESCQFQNKDQALKLLFSLVRFGLTIQNVRLIHILCECISKRVTFYIDTLNGIKDEFIFSKIVNQLQHRKAFNQLLEFLDFFLIGMAEFYQYELPDQLCDKLLEKLQIQYEIHLKNNLDFGKIVEFLNSLQFVYNNQKIKNSQFYKEIYQKGMKKRYTEQDFKKRIWDLLDDKKVEEKRFIGLKNLSNTCYLNSFIQALYMTPRFREFILNYNYQPQLKERDNFAKPDDFIRTIQKVFIFLKNVNKNVDLNPINLKRVQRDPYNKTQDQQDAGEFGAHFFEDLENQMDQNEWKKNIEKQFMGIYQVMLKCTVCKSVTKGPKETFMQLQVNLVDQTGSIVIRQANPTTNDMIKQLLQKEVIEYNCEKCKKINKIEKTQEFQLIPSTLILLLNRFRYENDVRRKITNYVKLDLEIEMEAENKKQKLDLYAIIVHLVNI